MFLVDDNVILATHSSGEKHTRWQCNIPMASAQVLYENCSVILYVFLISGLQVFHI